MPDHQVAPCEECYLAQVSSVVTENRLETDKTLENSICLSSANVKGLFFTFWRSHHPAGGDEVCSAHSS